MVHTSSPSVMTIPVSHSNITSCSTSTIPTSCSPTELSCRRHSRAIQEPQCMTSMATRTINSTLNSSNASDMSASPSLWTIQLKLYRKNLLSTITSSRRMEICSLLFTPSKESYINWIRTTSSKRLSTSQSHTSFPQPQLHLRKHG